MGSYLLGQWPRDADGASASCMNDKATQVWMRAVREVPGPGRGCRTAMAVNWAKRGNAAFPSIQLQLSRKAVFSPCAFQLHDSISVQLEFPWPCLEADGLWLSAPALAHCSFFFWLAAMGQVLI